MKKTCKTLIAIVVLSTVIIALSGCSNIYIPTAVSSPMLEEAGDISVTLYSGTCGGDLQGAYAIKDNLGIALHGSYLGMYDLKNRRSKHKHLLGEIAGLYFYDFGSTGKLELMAGYGGGSINTVYELVDFKNHEVAGMHKWFIQPSVGMRSDHMRASLAYRLAFVTLIQGGAWRTQTFMEPVLTFSIGPPNMKLLLQTGFSIPSVKTNTFGSQPFILNFGMQIKVNPKDFKKGKDEPVVM